MRELFGAASGLLGAFASYAGWRGVRAGGLVGAAAVLDGAGLLMLLPIISVVFEASAGRVHDGFVSRTLHQLGAVTPLQQLALLIAVFVVISAIRAVALYARDMALARLQTGFIEAERNRAMQALAGAPWHRVVGLRHARVTNLITNEISRLSSASYFMVQGVVLIAMLVIQTGIAFTLAPGLAAVGAALLLLGGGVFFATQGVTRDLGTGMVKAGQAMMANAAGFLSGLKTAAAQNAQASFVAEFESIQNEIRGRQLTFQGRQARGRLVFAIVSSLLGAAVVLLGYGYLQVTPAILATLVLVFGKMSGPAMQLYQSAQQFVFALPSFESVRGLESELRADSADHAAAPIAPPPGPITLSRASYAHPGGRGVQDATLTIPVGAFVGFAGPSGAGKTTLVDMIVGLLEPQSGEIRVGGALLKGGLRTGWAGAIAYVSQEGFLFHDTVRRNLSWSNPHATDAEIAEALELAGATAIVARMEQGLDTMVGERGTLLSGGERQRIGLARALLRKPRLLVLDEAANAIDAPGEAALLTRLAALDPRPTILMISHREESLAWCDRIVRVEAGSVSAG
ncbi:MAG: ABC transporter ATP-binding protein [Pseudomonadota bacterium]